MNYGKLLSGVWSNRALGRSSEDLSLSQASREQNTNNKDGDYVDMDIGPQNVTPTLDRKDFSRMDSPSSARKGSSAIYTFNSSLALCINHHIT